MLSERTSPSGPRPFRVRLRLAADPEAPAHARAALRPLAGQGPAARLQSVGLVVSELVTNAVRHSPAWGEASIGVEVLCAAHTVSIAVTDPGPGFEPQEREPGAGGGFGLYLVDELSDSWSVETVLGGTRVTAEMRL